MNRTASLATGGAHLTSSTSARSRRPVRAKPSIATVLIVDDEPDIVASLVQLIEDEIENVRAVGAYSGRRALELLADAPYSLVVSDFRMPGMDGLKFLAQVRDRWPDLPTALVTAYADEELARRAQEGQVGLFLPKPLPIDVFMKAVQTMIADP